MNGNQLNTTQLNSTQLNSNPLINTQLNDDSNLDDDFSAEIAGLVFNKPPGFVN